MSVMRADILHGDCRTLMAAMDAKSVDSVVTDAPYELGFMGSSWDSTGVAYDSETWRAALHVLKPGGFLLCFGGSPTKHAIGRAKSDGHRGLVPEAISHMHSNLRAHVSQRRMSVTRYLE